MGDQMHTFDGYDGMASALTALLQSGLSGFALGHSDVGGFTTVDYPLAKYPRTLELLKRWTEMSTFSDAILRTHPGSGPTSKGMHQVYESEQVQAQAQAQLQLQAKLQAQAQLQAEA